ncbi:MAG TPA: FimV/HubP family polar landmark protein [Dyella sp.]|nr:FimV/HubP family polar landmark protein [Dyella sp.]
MNRSLKLSILLALALGSSQVAAVELGQAHVKSALGQPLLVEIPVTQGTPAELETLSAQLASNEAFAKAGSERPTVPLQFNVVDVGGHRLIRVTSSSAVDDPYLDLLVEVNSSTGSTVREFAILLDPASKISQTPPTSSAPTRRAPASSASAPAETATAAPRHAAPARNAAASVKNGQFGPVEKGASLSHIATEVAPSGVDTNQMMLALKAANPDAFYRDNINALKAGAILRVPSRDDAMATAAEAAAAAVRQQNSDWRNGTVSAPVAVAAGGTRENASVAPAANSKADRLALVPPGSEAGGAGGKGGNNAAVRQELQRNQETLASLQQQSSELKSRLKDLEDLNNKNQHLLSLKDDEIADLQKKLAEARKGVGAVSAPVATNAPASTAPSKAVAPVAPASTHAAAQAPAPAAAPTAENKPATPPASAATAAHTAVTTPLKAPAKPVVAPRRAASSPESTEQPWYTQTWAMIAGGGVVVLLLLGLLARRGKSGAAKSPRVAPTGGSLADRFGTVEGEDDHDHSSADLDQEELLDQLAEQPDDIALHLELVSLYYSRRDVEHFEAAAEAMHAHITDPDQPEWQDVMHMGEDLAPGHPLFAHAAGDASGRDDHAPLHHFDLDSYANDRAASEAQPAAPAKNPSPLPSKVSEYHFDFDLTPHHGDSVSRTAAPAVKEDIEEEPVSTWNFEEPAEAPHTDHVEHADHDTFGELHDDPIDTKLDLARAYLDMGDPDGARAMLEEVLHEGSQMQRDVAKTLMEKIR